MSGDVIHPDVPAAATIAATLGDPLLSAEQTDALTRLIAAARWVAYSTASFPSGHARAPLTPPVSGAWLLEDEARGYLMAALSDVERLA